jgi:protein SCO1/2
VTHLRNFFAFVALCACVTTWAAPPARPLPRDSIYQLDIGLTDAADAPVRLADLRDRPVLIAMFYSSCPYVCPLIIDTMRRIELLPTHKDNLRFVLVSFDAEHETAQSLRAVAQQRHLDLSHWTLLRTDAANVRKLAAVLGVQYRAAADGGFNHSSIITLLDREGRIVARTSKMGESDPELLQAMQRQTADNAR